MRRPTRIICSAIAAASAMSWLLLSTSLSAAEPEKEAIFSTDKGDNARKTEGHEYSVTVVIGKEFAKKFGVKVAVKPEKSSDDCWLQAAAFAGSGKDTGTIYIGMDVPTHEKFTLLLLKYEKGKKISREGSIAVDQLESRGFEIIDKIQVERMNYRGSAWARSDSREAQAGADGTRTLTLIPAPGPPEWGKNLPGSSGELQFHPKSNGTFIASMKLSGLEPKKAYKLGFNGRDGYDGNELLYRFGKDGPTKGKYDFQTVTTDSFGAVSGEIKVALPKGRYHVKFFVKDIGDKYTCVLGNDDLQFEVKPLADAQQMSVKITKPSNGDTTSAAIPENKAIFSTDKGDNARKTEGHEYSVTVVIGKEFAKTFGVKVAVKPEKSSDNCWLQAAAFTGPGKDTGTVYIGMDVTTHEKFTLLLLKYEKGKKLSREGRIAIDQLESQGFEIIDKIQVERTK
jgi:hypothetical protein